jgi:hypothetical protein
VVLCGLFDDTVTLIHILMDIFANILLFHGKQDFSEKKAAKRNFKRKEEKEVEWNARSFMLLFKWGGVVALCHS